MMRTKFILKIFKENLFIRKYFFKVNEFEEVRA